MALIDDEDFELVNQRRWHILPYENTTYAASSVWDKVSKKDKTIRMHRFIMSAPQGLEVDHINGNGLDNRRSNLRLATRAQNQHNRGLNRNNKSGFKGVVWYPRYNKWLSVIIVDGQRKHLGYFSELEDAVAAYQEAALRYQGEFARAI